MKKQKAIFAFLTKATWNSFPNLALIFRYISIFDRIPNFFYPKTFNEIILKKLIFDRNPLLPIYADKDQVRNFVSARLGTEEILPKIYAKVDRPEEILNLSELPRRFVFKPNHGSGWYKIVHDYSSEMKESLVTLGNEWLGVNYGKLRNEWAYQPIRPCLLFEELLSDQTPIDYRFLCFWGAPQLIYIRIQKQGRYYINFYDLEFKRLPLSYHHSNFFNEIPKPLNWKEMLKIAEKLAAGSDSLRVDLYNIDGRIVFGELTNYPNGGEAVFNPPEWDLKIGSYYSR